MPDPAHPNRPTFETSKLLHGGDYNPDQWLDTPEVWDEDIRLMKLAGVNAVSVGIFSWATLEPEEGRFTFDWLDTIFDKLWSAGVSIFLATPSGGKPGWLAHKYPEVRMVDANGQRAPQRGRHNHCKQSSIYREKCVTINTKLAERYGQHPALKLWHVSNEYSKAGCYCNLCLAAFRDFLRERYDDSLDKLNHAYWSNFWSHTYTDWDHILPVDGSVHGLMLDWQRFITHQTIDFFKAESQPLREITPHIPITTNFHHAPGQLDYWALSKYVDIVTWDAYPFWHEREDPIDPAIELGFVADRCRAMMGGKPWLLMESVPSIPTRGKLKKRKEPGVNLLSGMQAVAQGSDGVLYFQWRKGRGGLEKFHGAIVDHVGTEHTRVFREVQQISENLGKLDDVTGTHTTASVALLHDFENEWAVNSGAKVYLGPNADVLKACHAHYRPFWEAGISLDVIDQTVDLSAYQLVVLPLVYMLRPGFAQRLAAFVEAGGTAVMTYWSAVVDESDLCYLGGVPGDGLRDVFGVWEEESQSYLPHERVGVAAADGNALGLSGSFEASNTCSVIHAEGAEVLATYSDQYFAGSPAATVHRHGNGHAYYLAADLGQDFLQPFYNALATQHDLPRNLNAQLPPGVTAQRRTDGKTDTIFLLNFNPTSVTVTLDQPCHEQLTGEPIGPTVELDAYAVKVLRAMA